MAVFLEVFILIGVALLGSALVYAAVSKYASATEGAGVSVSDLTVSQGSGVAFERLVVSNTGTAPAPEMLVETSGLAQGVGLCYSVSTAGALELLASTCPSFAAMPATVTVPVPLSPGQSVVVEFTIEGEAFRVGSQCQVVVSTANGAQASLIAEVLPA